MDFSFIKKYTEKHFEIKPSLFLSDWICYEIVFLLFYRKIHIFIYKNTYHIYNKE